MKTKNHFTSENFHSCFSVQTTEAGVGKVYSDVNAPPTLPPPLSPPSAALCLFSPGSLLPSLSALCAETANPDRRLGPELWALCQCLQCVIFSLSACFWNSPAPPLLDDNNVEPLTPDNSNVITFPRSQLGGMPFRWSHVSSTSRAQICCACCDAGSEQFTAEFPSRLVCQIRKRG